MPNELPMEKVSNIAVLIRRVASDDQLSKTHLSLMLALCHNCISGTSKDSFQISRRRLMGQARINSAATYHKVIRDLQQSGYISYLPSYHPVNGSRVKLLIENIKKDPA